MMPYSQEATQSFAKQIFAFLQIKEENHVLEITLNRPEKKNALNPTMVNELAYALSYAHHNRDVRAVVLAANGTIFCAGADLKAFMAKNTETTSTIPAPTAEVVIGNLFKNLHRPCIAKMNAPLYAGGHLLVCGCTHVVATPAVSFSLPEVKRGLWPMQVMQSLLAIMPARKMLDWCMRAYKIDAEEAQQLGLVSHLVNDVEELDKRVNELVADIVSKAPAAIKLGLQAYQELQNIKADEAHGYLKKMLGEVLQTQDAMEGIMAFQQKRAPVWKGK